MLRHLYRWLYHYRQRRATRSRLSGRGRPSQRFWRFGYHVLHRAEFDKYGRSRPRKRLVWRVFFVLLVLAVLWFVWQSAQVWHIFQG